MIEARKFKMLVLTDHECHKDDDTVFAQIRELQMHSSCEGIDVASKANKINEHFFKNFVLRLFVNPVTNTFQYSENTNLFTEKFQLARLDAYQVLLVWLPEQENERMTNFLRMKFPNKKIVVRPIKQIVPLKIAKVQAINGSKVTLSEHF